MADSPNAFDKYASFSDTASSPARQIFVVVPDANGVKDDQGRPVVLKGLRATGAGTVTIKTTGSPTGYTHPVLDGERIDARITHVTAMTGVTGLTGYA